jgi:glyoxylase-like metal-dependent hydrolase (beta-lactamase superfamily II)
MWIFEFFKCGWSKRAEWIVCLFGAFLVAGFLPNALHAAEGDYQVQQLKPNVFAWIPDDVVDLDGDPHYSRAASVGFIITPQGVVVAGATNNPLHAREVLFEIRRRTDAPVIDVIDLDAEGDQVLGNEVFAEQRAQIIASSAAASEMRDYQADLAARQSHQPDLRTHLRGIHFTLPTQTFERQLTLRAGDTEVQVVQVNAGAAGESSGDAVVFLPQSGVLFLGDLFDRGYVPTMDSRDIRHWIQALGQLENWKVEVFVPAHGLPGSRQDVEAFRQFLQWIVSEVETRIEEGKSLRQVRQELTDSAQFRLHGWENVPETLTEVYRQLVHTPAANSGGNGKGPESSGG